MQVLSIVTILLKYILTDKMEYHKTKNAKGATYV